MKLELYKVWTQMQFETIHTIRSQFFSYKHHLEQSAIMDAPKSYYLYNPSEPLAGVVAGLYGVSFCITLWQIIRKKAWVWLFMLLAIASK